MFAVRLSLYKAYEPGNISFLYKINNVALLQDISPDEPSVIMSIISSQLGQSSHEGAATRKLFKMAPLSFHSNLRRMFHIQTLIEDM